jgi:uncharacterized protein (DUF1330 family)
MGKDFIDPERAAFEVFKSLPRNEPVEMLNLVRFRPTAAYKSGHPLAGQSISGAEAYAAYSRESAPVFQRVGGTIIWSATPELVLIGPADERWDIAFVARYPSASAFLAMVTNEQYRHAVVHRQAAVLTSRLVRNAPKTGGGTAFG